MRAMTKNNKGRNGGDRVTLKTTYSQNHTVSDSLIGLALAKASRDRQQKRGWKRNQRGQIDSALALLLVLPALILAGVEAS